MLEFLIPFVILVLVLGFIWWLVSLLPLPAPFPLIIQVVMALIALIVVIDLLLGLSHGGGHFLMLR